MMQVFDVLKGDSPIVLGQPHGGINVPDYIAARLNATGAELADTDWHINRLYAGLLPGATVVKSNIHRYVIDANRDPAGVSLYPGQSTTALVPLTDFDGQAIWAEGQNPSDDEIEFRCVTYRAPYHNALLTELERVRAKYGVAILFEGELPIFNTGTNLGKTCAPEVEGAVDTLARTSGMSAVLNGRFKGGWTTRHYGQPETGIHAIQMEIAQRAYMREVPPWQFYQTLATSTRQHLLKMLENLKSLALSGTINSGGNAQ